MAHPTFDTGRGVKFGMQRAAVAAATYDLSALSGTASGASLPLGVPPPRPTARERGHLP